MRLLVLPDMAGSAAGCGAAQVDQGRIDYVGRRNSVRSRYPAHMVVGPKSLGLADRTAKTQKNFEAY